MSTKARSGLEEISADGQFARKDAVWRNWVKEGDSQFPPEANRYHLYISHSCPWANRCHAVLRMKGLEKVISISVAHPTWQATRPGQDEHRGWAFASESDEPFTSPTGYGSFPATGCIPDTINNAKFVRDLYELAKDSDGKYTLPILWDVKTQTIVSNESADIISMLNSAFNQFSTNPQLDLNPENLRGKIEEINKWVYPGINNGVYRCGFAQTQTAYNAAFDELFDSLDKCEEMLSQSRYLCGETLTLADIRLFMTLIRFDLVYIVYFKADKKRLSVDYPNLFEYMKDLYQMPCIGETIDFYHIKTHYFSSHPNLNVYAIVPRGDVCDFNAPHDRARFDTPSAKKA